MIVFVHWGRPPLYLVAAMMTARLSNPLAKIVILTDVPPTLPSVISRFLRIESHNLNAYSQSAGLFKNDFRYQGRASYHYELRCFTRWFVLHEFVSAVRWNQNFLYLDSDALFLDSLDNLSKYVSEGMTLSNTCGPAFSFFRSPDDLRDYVDYISRVWREEDEFSRVEELVSSLAMEGLPYVSDMATLASWSQVRNLTDLQDLPAGYPIFCENPYEVPSLGAGPTEFKMKWRPMENAAWFHAWDGTRHRAGGLHLQGGSKRLWPKFTPVPVLLATLALFPKGTITAITEASRYQKKLRSALKSKGAISQVR